jgi:putative oxidoreductase
MNPKLQSFALTGLRLALATAFLSAVAGRLGLWGKYGNGWVKFVDYVASVNWYLPARTVPPVAITATILETALGWLCSPASKYATLRWAAPDC